MLQGHLIDQLRITDPSGVSVAKLDRWYVEVHASNTFKTGVTTHATWWTCANSSNGYHIPRYGIHVEK